MTNPASYSENDHQHGAETMALAYGYMRVLDDMESEEIQVIRNRLFEYAKTHGFKLAKIHVEYRNGVTDVGALVAFLNRHDAEHVIMPSLGQITDHIVVQVAVAVAILSDVGAELHVTANEQRDE